VIRRKIASSGSVVGSIIAAIISSHASACRTAGTSHSPCGTARQIASSAGGVHPAAVREIASVRTRAPQPERGPGRNRQRAEQRQQHRSLGRVANARGSRDDGGVCHRLGQRWNGVDSSRRTPRSTGAGRPDL
jgi:hypothetical protein